MSDLEEGDDDGDVALLRPVTHKAKEEECESDEERSGIPLKDFAELRPYAEHQLFTVDQAIQYAGVGAFQARLMVFCGVAWMTDSMETTLLAFVQQAMACAFEGRRHSQNSMGAVLSSSIFVGQMLGALFWGALSDGIGRRRVYIASMACVGIAGAVSSAANSEWMLIACRFIVGFGIPGGTVAVALFNEYLPIKSRGRYMMSMAAFYSGGAVVQVLFAWALLPVGPFGWRLLCIASAIVALAAAGLAAKGYLPESPRFLLAKGRETESRAQLLEVLRTNKRLPAAEFPVGCLALTDREASDASGSVIKRRMLFQKPDLRRVVLSLALVWLCASTVYVGMIIFAAHFASENFPAAGVAAGDDGATSDDTACESAGTLFSNNGFLAVLATTLAELPGLGVAFFLVNQRRVRSMGLLLTSMATLAACAAALYGARAGAGPVVVLVFGVRMLITAMLQIIFIYAPEAFPTQVRTTAMGMLSACSEIGGVIAPFALVALSSLSNQLFLFALICLTSACVALLYLPESKARPHSHLEQPEPL